MSKLKHTILFVFAATTSFLNAQTTENDSVKIADYLYSQLVYKQIRTSCQVLDSISSAELYCSRMEFPMGDGGVLPTTYDLIKVDGKFKSVYSAKELICTPEFIASLNKDYSIRDIEDALRFQEILDVVDNWNNLNSDRKIFQSGNKWVFIRDESFGEYDHYTVETDKQGHLKSISYADGDENLKLTDDATKSSGHRSGWGYKAPKVSASDSAYLRQYLNERCNFYFEFTKRETGIAQKLTGADFYDSKLVFTQDNFSSANGFGLMKFNDSILHANSTQALLQKPLFTASLNSDFVLKSKKNAQMFEEALDAIAPVSTFDVDNKEHLQIDGVWYFVRSESFGDKNAFVVETNGKGTITSFTFKNGAIPGS